MNISSVVLGLWLAVMVAGCGGESEGGHSGKEEDLSSKAGSGGGSSSSVSSGEGGSGSSPASTGSGSGWQKCSHDYMCEDDACVCASGPQEGYSCCDPASTECSDEEKCDYVCEYCE